MRSIANTAAFFFCAVASLIPRSQAADLQEIVRRGTAAIRSDWAADPDYAFVEKDETQKNGEWTSKTFQVLMIEGSDYNMPLAVNDVPLTPEQKKSELEKLKQEVQHRKSESPSARSERIEKFKKQSDENGALLLEFPNTFTFELKGEGTADGHAAYILAATPHKRSSAATTRAEKVLSGMEGTVWVDKETFHVIRAECNVLAPVPIYGILARVMPGTHITLSMSPVTDSTWLITSLAMDLSVSKLMLMRSKQVTRSTYSGYRLNALVLADLLKP